MKHPELNIPYSLAREILREKKFAQFRVWIAAKGVHGAFCKKEDLDKKEIANLCGFSSTQTVDYHFDKLLSWNWIGEDDNNYFFRPIKYLCQQYDISKKARSYVLDLENELEDLQAVLFYMAVKRVIGYRRYMEAHNGAYQQIDANGYTLQSYTAQNISVRLLSKLIGISVNMVHRLKKYAGSLQYLDISHNNRLVLPFEKAYLNHFHREKLYKVNNCTILRMTDTIKTIF